MDVPNNLMYTNEHEWPFMFIGIHKIIRNIHFSLLNFYISNLKLSKKLVSKSPDLNCSSSIILMWYGIVVFGPSIIVSWSALQETIIEGPKTTIPYHIKIMEDEQFRSGDFDTSFLESFKFEI